MKQRLKAYLWNVLIGADQLLNCLLSGYPDETFSARAYRKAQAGQLFWRMMHRLIDHLFFWQPHHCRSAYQSEAAKRHSPKEFTNVRPV